MDGPRPPTILLRFPFPVSNRLSVFRGTLGQFKDTRPALLLTHLSISVSSTYTSNGEGALLLLVDSLLLHLTLTEAVTVEVSL